MRKPVQSSKKLLPGKRRRFFYSYYGANIEQSIRDAKSFAYSVILSLVHFLSFYELHTCFESFIDFLSFNYFFFVF